MGKPKWQWKAKPDSTVYVVEVAYYGCLPEHQSVLLTLEEARDTLRRLIEDGEFEKVGIDFYEHKTAPLQAFIREERLDSFFFPTEGDTLGEVVDTINNW